MSQHLPLTGTRVVWTGRFPEDGDGLDGWTTTDDELARALVDAAELVVLDPLSFPWKVLGGRRDVPMVVRLPDGLPAVDVAGLLGRTVLEHVTPYDRLLCADPEVRAALTTDFALPSYVWVDPSGPVGDAPWADALLAHFRRDLVDLTTDLGHFLAPDDDLVTRHLREHGAHQRGTLNALLSVVRPGDVVVDAGAHIGTFAVPLARAVGAGGALLAVEGSASTFSLLSHNLAASGVGGWASPRHAVLAADEHWVVPGERDEHNTGSQAFLTVSDDGVGGAGRGVAGATRSVTLDRLVGEVLGERRPDLVKIDVEGAELEVLRGASTVLSARPMLCLEVSGRQLAGSGAGADTAPGSSADAEAVDVLDALLTEHRYERFVVRGPRQSRDSAFELEHVVSLRDPDDDLFDVLAVPADSPRLADLMTRGQLATSWQSELPTTPTSADPATRPVPHTAPRLAPRQAKRAFVLAIDAVARELKHPHREAPGVVVETYGDLDVVAPLRRASGCVVQRFEVESDEVFVPSPQVGVVWLDDGDQSAQAIAGLLREAFNRVGVGGRLVVLSYVVDRPGGGANPTIGQLVESLSMVSFGGVHVDELRSLQLPGEPWARGVVLGAARLGPRDYQP